jgi:hypothetical protein
MKDTSKVYTMCVDWVESGMLHHRIFSSESYSNTFDMAYQFASVIRSKLDIPMSEILIVDNTGVLS